MSKIFFVEGVEVWMNPKDMSLTVGRYYVAKYREQAKVSGYAQAARNLRKQGVPLTIALFILLGAA